MGAEQQIIKIEELAKSKLQMRMGVRRELKKLPDRLDEGEEVLNLASGSIGAKTGLIVVTDRRVLFFAASMASTHQEEFPYRSVSSIEATTGMMSGKMRIFASGNKAEIKDVYPKGAVDEIADFVRARIGGHHGASAGVHPSPRPDAAERLRKLQRLRDDGLVTDAEFEAKRAELLSEL